MASTPESTSMALFCDFENVALGVRDAKYDRFDIKRVLERLLLKGSIVVKKAYCDWDRYKHFKATMHEANFELIEIPHVRQSGKNSADIRLVVDALDLCYTKSHVDTFVIISGDSDFSPLVSKLRENAKQVIGVGVKQSTSDLLIANCDEFIFYDDLVREGQRAAARRVHQDPSSGRRHAEDEGRRGSQGGREDAEARRAKAIDLAVETLEALGSERGDGGKIRASRLKDAIKRRKPDFNETYFGFRSFGSLLEEAQARGLLEVVRDEKGNGYVQRAPARVTEPGAPAVEMRAPIAHGLEAAAPVPMPGPAPDDEATAVRLHVPEVDAPAPTPARRSASRGGSPRAGRKTTRAAAPAAQVDPIEVPVAEPVEVAHVAVEAQAEAEASSAPKPSRPRSRTAKAPAGRRPRKPAVEVAD